MEMHKCWVKRSGESSPKSAAKSVIVTSESESFKIGKDILHLGLDEAKNVFVAQTRYDPQTQSFEEKNIPVTFSD